MTKISEDLAYHRLVGEAGERAAEQGCVDLVDLSRAAEAGYSIHAFQSDAEKAADELTRGDYR